MKIPSMNRAAGFTLIEVLVALMLGVLLLAGLVNIFANSAKLYARLEARSEVMESGRFAVDAIAQDLRQAGNWGCLGNDSSLVTSRLQEEGEVPFSLPFLVDGIRVFHPDVAGWNALPQAVRTAAVPGQSALLVSGVRDTGIRIRDIDSDNTQLSGLEKVWDGFLGGLENGDLVLAVNSTCERGELFKISSVQRNAGNAIVLGYAAAAAGSFGNQAFDLLDGLGVTTGQNILNQDRGIQLYRVFSHLYFIGDAADNDNGISLMRRDLANGDRVLVPDITGMYFHLGVGDAENLTDYVYELDGEQTPISSWNSQDWARVRAVRFSLLATSPPVEMEAGRIQQLAFRPGQAAVILAGRYGAVYSSTTALRARIRN
jgi:type IV pilus assembly protein PilW